MLLHQILHTKNDGHTQHIKGNICFEYAIHLITTMKECEPLIFFLKLGIFSFFYWMLFRNEVWKNKIKLVHLLEIRSPPNHRNCRVSNISCRGRARPKTTKVNATSCLL